MSSLHRRPVSISGWVGTSESSGSRASKPVRPSVSYRAAFSVTSARPEATYGGMVASPSRSDEMTTALNDRLSDADLWGRVRAGDSTAFETLVRRHQSLICSVAYSYCGDLALSEDVAQETFWAAWRDREQLAQP